MTKGDEHVTLRQRLRAWLDGQAARFFFFKMEAIAAEEASVVQAQAVEAQRRAFEQALEAARWAKQAAGDDPDEQAILEAFREGIVGNAQAMQRILATGHPVDPQDRREALGAPFDGSGSSMPPSPNGSPAGLPGPSTQAGPTPPPVPMPVPARRGRGRPRKHPLPPTSPPAAPPEPTSETGPTP